MNMLIFGLLLLLAGYFLRRHFQKKIRPPSKPSLVISKATQEKALAQQTVPPAPVPIKETPLFEPTINETQMDVGEETDAEDAGDETRRKQRYNKNQQKKHQKQRKIKQQQRQRAKKREERRRRCGTSDPTLPPDDRIDRPKSKYYK